VKRGVSKRLAVLSISSFCWSGDPRFRYTLYTPWVIILEMKLVCRRQLHRKCITINLCIAIRQQIY